MFLQRRSYGRSVKKYLPGFMFNAVLIAVNMLFFSFLCTFLDQFKFCYLCRIIFPRIFTGAGLNCFYHLILHVSC